MSSTACRSSRQLQVRRSPTAPTRGGGCVPRDVLHSVLTHRTGFSSSQLSHTMSTKVCPPQADASACPLRDVCLDGRPAHCRSSFLQALQNERWNHLKEWLYFRCVRGGSLDARARQLCRPFRICFWHLYFCVRWKPEMYDGSQLADFRDCPRQARQGWILDQARRLH